MVDEKLTAQIAQEAKELQAAPVIKPIVGMVERCHLCGGVFSASQLKPFDMHVPNGAKRKACPNCHPDRNIT